LPLATLFSAELTEAQTKYLAMRAMFDADQKRLQRTQQLIDIGAVSRQELEEAEAAAASRATKVRVEVPNPEGRLRLGMYVTMAFSTARGERVTAVPRAAVQTIGGSQVVFIAVPDEEGKFVQRTVTLGPLIGESYTVLQGLEPGAVVVTEGSFFLRAESLRYAPAG
jgi:multidrug efflux pump subunit AcrA (membrane-fusion protein)